MAIANDTPHIFRLTISSLLCRSMLLFRFALGSVLFGKHKPEYRPQRPVLNITSAGIETNVKRLHRLCASSRPDMNRPSQTRQVAVVRSRQTIRSPVQSSQHRCILSSSRASRHGEVVRFHYHHRCWWVVHSLLVPSVLCCHFVGPIVLIVIVSVDKIVH